MYFGAHVACQHPLSLNQQKDIRDRFAHLLTASLIESIQTFRKNYRIGSEPDGLIINPNQSIVVLHVGGTQRTVLFSTESKGLWRSCPQLYEYHRLPSTSAYGSLAWIEIVFDMHEDGFLRMSSPMPILITDEKQIIKEMSGCKRALFAQNPQLLFSVLQDIDSSLHGNLGSSSLARVLDRD
eukprot:scaffold168270_cov24-Prasinocladus_malaysianus.AAC.1